MHFLFSCLILFHEDFETSKGSQIHRKIVGSYKSMRYLVFSFLGVPGPLGPPDPPSSTLNPPEPHGRTDCPVPSSNFYFYFIFRMGGMDHMSLMKSHTFKPGIS